MAGGVERRTLVNVAGWSGANEEGHHECSSDDHPAPDLERRPRGFVALVIAVAILAALLIANVGNDSSASTRSVVPTQSSSTPGADIACWRRSPVLMRNTSVRPADPRNRAPGGVRRGTPRLNSKKAGLASASPAYASGVQLLEREAELSALEECIGGRGSRRRTPRRDLGRGWSRQDLARRGAEPPRIRRSDAVGPMRSAADARALGPVLDVARYPRAATSRSWLRVTTGSSCSPNSSRSAPAMHRRRWSCSRISIGRMPPPSTSSPSRAAGWSTRAACSS